MIEHYRTLGRSSAGPAVILVAQASYHLAELVPLREELVRRGLAAELAAPIPPRKLANRFRPGPRRHAELISASRDRVGATQSIDLIGDRAIALVVMNDWGVTRPLVEMVRAKGRPTFAWVEGVQDFDDLDTGRERRPYRTVDHIFCLGRHDATQLAGSKTTIVGSTRLREIWERPPVDSRANSLVTINSNFTYGVLSEVRRSWVGDCAKACEEVGTEWALSRHVAERGTALPHRANRAPVSELLIQSSHLVSRFSTVGYEALVRGVPLLYHNPHREQAGPFRALEGAIALTRSSADLVEALTAPAIAGTQVRANAASFLAEHLRLEPGDAPARLAADAIVAGLEA